MFGFAFLLRKILNNGGEKIDVAIIFVFDNYANVGCGGRRVDNSRSVIMRIFLGALDLHDWRFCVRFALQKSRLFENIVTHTYTYICAAACVCVCVITGREDRVSDSYMSILSLWRIPSIG